MAQQANLFEGHRRGTCIYHAGDGFYFYKDNSSDVTLNLRCIMRYRCHCHGRALLDLRTNEITHTQAHNHQPDCGLVEHRQLRRRILVRCRTGAYLSYRTVLDEECNNFHVDISSRVTLPQMRTSMRNARMERYPLLPHSLHDLAEILADQQFSFISRTIDNTGSVFRKEVVATDGSVSVIFSSERMIRYLERVTIIFADGTFVTPALPRASQVLNIVTLWNFHVIPLMSVLMESRTIPAYKSIFQEMKIMCPNFNPETTMTDFELALLAAIQAEFPNADASACLYHFIAAITSYAKDELGMTAFIRDNPAVKRILQLCCAIPLAPPEFLRTAMRTIAAEAKTTVFYDDLIPFFTYLWNTWMVGPRYPVLSVSGCPNRTNNACESFNNMLRTELGPNHPNIFRFIDGIRKIEQTAYTDIWRLWKAHHPSRTRKSESLSNDLRIQTWTKYLEDNQCTMRDFLHNVSPSCHGAMEHHLRGRRQRQ